MAISFVDVQNSEGDIALLNEFYRGIYIAGFPDADERESLENMQNYLTLRDEGWYEKNNYHILLAMDGGRTIGGAVCDYLAESNVGVIEFLLVADSHRGLGLGRTIHEAIVEVLQIDAIHASFDGLAGIVIEMNDPFRVDLLSDNMDPFARAAIWGKWGYCALRFPYVQPALSESQLPVTYLLLCVKPMIPQWQHRVPAKTVRLIVFGYLKWAMRIENPEEDPTFHVMSRSIGEVDQIRHTELNRYIGVDSKLPFEIVSISSDRDPNYAELMRAYSQSFPSGDTVIDHRAFGTTLNRVGNGESGLHYHLWGVRLDNTVGMQGIASFYCLTEIGFGGYIALEPPLRGTGRCRLLIARIEEQMIRDQAGLQGWYIECEPGSSAVGVFERLGFRRASSRYIQPSLHAFDASIPPDSIGPELVLMYKPLALGYARESKRAIEVDVLQIMKKVYCIRDPEATAAYRTFESFSDNSAASSTVNNDI